MFLFSCFQAVGSEQPMSEQVSLNFSSSAYHRSNAFPSSLPLSQAGRSTATALCSLQPFLICESLIFFPVRVQTPQKSCETDCHRDCHMLPWNRQELSCFSRLRWIAAKYPQTQLGGFWIKLNQCFLERQVCLQQGPLAAVKSSTVWSPG